MTTKEEFIVIGRIATAHGIKGGLKVLSYTQPKEKILEYNPWWINHQGHWHPIKLTSTKGLNAALIIYVEGCTDRNQAEKLTGSEIGVERKQLPTLPVNEYYWHELIGLTVMDSLGKQLGIINSLIETGSNDVMVVKNENGKEILIPYRPGPVVLKINLADKIMVVDWDPNF